MTDITHPCADRALVHPALVRKDDAILAEINPLCPPGWRLKVYETYRSPARQRWLFDHGVSKIPDATGAHCRTPSRAEDLVWTYLGQWSWLDPVLRNGRRGWQQLQVCKRNHGLRIIAWDKPHCELAAKEV